MNVERTDPLTRPPSPETTDVELVRATTPAHYDAARRLFREYAGSLEIDLCFQGFESELAALESMYAPPSGSLLLAIDGDEAVACVAVRALPTGEQGTCEMKRLYVQPDHRKQGLGRTLAMAILDEGRRLGYRRMVLDTLESMERARAIYGELGFRETDPYYANPFDGVRYMRADLDDA